ncbi:MAG: hypothetical protein LLF28_04560 [Nitrospiraceae bacterium]|nr:hypothetical protein [Nitrospiraceae bacterium]
MINLERRILINRTNAKIFSLRKEVYIVGGYLRNIFAGKKGRDIDYIVRGDIKKFAEIVYKKLNLDHEKASLVELKKEQLFRIIFKDGSTLDFTELKSMLEDNLAERDFTMNALAWSSQTGLIDLFGGINDIKNKRIKAISIDNFRKDPLRLLRTYRFAAELGWIIDSNTRSIVKKLCGLIKNSASERITSEFFKLLDSKNYFQALKLAYQDRLLKHFISIEDKKLSKNISSFLKLESSFKKIPIKYKNALDETFSQELSLKGLMRLELILYGSTLSRNRLSLSRQIQERMKNVHKLQWQSGNKNLFSKKNMFETFLKLKFSALDFVILSNKLGFIAELERFNHILHKGLLNTHEIMKLTRLKEGLELGEFIRKLKKMQFEGKLKTKKQAIKLLETTC